MNKFLGSVELALPNDTSSRTLASVLVGRITADIIEGKLVPGEKLRLPDLSARYECGVSPLREALARLSSTGLVVQEDQKGFRVSTVSGEDLSDLTEVRTEIECLLSGARSCGEIWNGRRESFPRITGFRGSIIAAR